MNNTLTFQYDGKAVKVTATSISFYHHDAWIMRAYNEETFKLEEFTVTEISQLGANP